MADIAELAIRIRHDGIEQASRGLDRLAQSADRAEREVDGFGRGVDRGRRPLEELGRGTDRLHRGMSAVATPIRALTGMLAALGVALGVREIIQYADSWRLMGARINLVTRDLQETGRIQEELVQIAVRTGQSLDSTATIFTRMAGAAERAGFSQDQMLQATEALNQAILLSGASSTEASAALLQFSQAINSNKLGGEELNSVYENMSAVITRVLIPGIQRIAPDLQITEDNFRELAAQGVLTRDLLIGAMVAMSGGASQLARDAAEIPITFDRAFQTIKTAFQVLVGTMDQATGASTAVATAIDDLGRAMIRPEFREFARTVATGIAAGFRLWLNVMGAVVSGVADVARALGRLTGIGLDDVGRAFVAIRRAVADAGKAVRVFLGQADDLGGAFDPLARSAREAVTEIGRLAAARFTDLNRTLEDAGGGLRGLRDDVDAVRGYFNGLGRDLGRLFGALDFSGTARSILAIRDALNDAGRPLRTLIGWASDAARALGDINASGIRGIGQGVRDAVNWFRDLAGRADETRGAVAALASVSLDPLVAAARGAWGWFDRLIDVDIRRWIDDLGSVRLDALVALARDAVAEFGRLVAIRLGEWLAPLGRIDLDTLVAAARNAYEGFRRLIGLDLAGWLRTLATDPLGALRAGAEAAWTALRRILDLDFAGWRRGLAADPLASLRTGAASAFDAFSRLAGIDLRAWLGGLTGADLPAFAANAGAIAAQFERLVGTDLARWLRPLAGTPLAGLAAGAGDVLRAFERLTGLNLTGLLTSVRGITEGFRGWGEVLDPIAARLADLGRVTFTALASSVADLRSQLTGGLDDAGVAFERLSGIARGLHQIVSDIGTISASALTALANGAREALRWFGRLDGLGLVGLEAGVRGVVELIGRLSLMTLDGLVGGVRAAVQGFREFATGVENTSGGIAAVTRDAAGFVALVGRLGALTLGVWFTQLRDAVTGLRDLAAAAADVGRWIAGIAGDNLRPIVDLANDIRDAFARLTGIDVAAWLGSLRGATALDGLIADADLAFAAFTRLTGIDLAGWLAPLRGIQLSGLIGEARALFNVFRDLTGLKLGDFLRPLVGGVTFGPIIQGARDLWSWLGRLRDFDFTTWLRPLVDLTRLDLSGPFRTLLDHLRQIGAALRSLSPLSWFGAFGEAAEDAAGAGKELRDSILALGRTTLEVFGPGLRAAAGAQRDLGDAIRGATGEVTIHGDALEDTLGGYRVITGLTEAYRRKVAELDATERDRIRTMLDIGRATQVVFGPAIEAAARRQSRVNEELAAATRDLGNELERTVAARRPLIVTNADYARAVAGTVDALTDARRGEEQLTGTRRQSGTTTRELSDEEKKLAERRREAIAENAREVSNLRDRIAIQERLAGVTADYAVSERDAQRVREAGLRLGTQAARNYQVQLDALQRLEDQQRIDNELRKVGLDLTTEMGRTYAAGIQSALTLARAEETLNDILGNREEIVRRIVLETNRGNIALRTFTQDEIERMREVNESLRERPEIIRRITLETREGSIALRQFTREEIERLNEVPTAARRAAEIMRQSWENAVEGIQEILAGGFERLFAGEILSAREFADEFVNLFRGVSAQIASAFTTSLIVDPLKEAFSSFWDWLKTGFNSVLESIAGAFGTTAQNLRGYLGALGAGAGIGAVTSGLTGGNQLVGTIGGAVGGAAGRGLGQLVAPAVTTAVTGALGATIGDAIGSALPVVGTVFGGILGGLVGNLFGNKPSDRTQIASINLATGKTSTEGLTGKKFSEENQKLANSFIEGTVNLKGLLEQLTGGKVTGSVSAVVGDREGIRIRTGVGAGRTFTDADTPQEAAAIIARYLIRSVENIRDPYARAALPNIDIRSLGTIERDLGLIQRFSTFVKEAGKAADDASSPTRQLALYLRGTFREFNALSRQTERLKLPTDDLQEALVERIGLPIKEFIRAAQGAEPAWRTLQRGLNETFRQFDLLYDAAKRAGRATDDLEEGMRQHVNLPIQEFIRAAQGAEPAWQTLRRGLNETFATYNVLADAARRANRSTADLDQALQQHINKPIQEFIQASRGGEASWQTLRRSLNETFATYNVLAEAARRANRSTADLDAALQRHVNIPIQEFIRSAQGGGTAAQQLAASLNETFQTYNVLSDAARRANRDTADLDAALRQHVQNPINEFIASIRGQTQIGQLSGQLTELRERFLVLRDAAREVGLPIAELSAAFREGIAGLRGDFLNTLRSLAGIDVDAGVFKIADQFRTIQAEFQQALDLAPQFNVTTGQVRDLYGAAIKNLGKDFGAGLKAAVEGVAQDLNPGNVRQKLEEIRAQWRPIARSIGIPVEHFDAVWRAIENQVVKGVTNGSKDAAGKIQISLDSIGLLFEGIQVPHLGRSLETIRADLTTRLTRAVEEFNRPEEWRHVLGNLNDIGARFKSELRAANLDTSWVDGFIDQFREAVNAAGRRGRQGRPIEVDLSDLQIEPVNVPNQRVIPLDVSDVRFEPIGAGRRQQVIPIDVGDVRLEAKVPRARRQTVEVDLPIPRLKVNIPQAQRQVIPVDLPIPRLKVTVPQARRQVVDVEVPAPRQRVILPRIPREAADLRIPVPRQNVIRPNIPRSSVDFRVPAPRVTTSKGVPRVPEVHFFVPAPKVTVTRGKGFAEGGDFTVGRPDPRVQQQYLGRFQFGGSNLVRGLGGTDSTLVSFLATPGERVTVTPPGGAAPLAVANDPGSARDQTLRSGFNGLRGDFRSGVEAIVNAIGRNERALDNMAERIRRLEDTQRARGKAERVA
jgi:tape measure domain-containing protein